MLRTASARDAWPHGMIATSTHDTKRARTRGRGSQRCSELPEAWADAWARWREVVVRRCPSSTAARRPMPTTSTSCFRACWRVAAGAPRQRRRGGGGRFRDRIEGFVTKALREAKRHSNWVHVNEPYEAAALDLVRRLLGPDTTFLDASGRWHAACPISAC
jgi:(1->4)-alpha-D-glucan 1-alpha-D-glucosylmutase